MSKAPFIGEPSDQMVLTGPGGLGVVGQLVASLPLGTELNRATVPGAEHPDISHRDVVVSCLGAVDVSPFDNSKTRKEGVSRTDKGCPQLGLPGPRRLCAGLGVPRGQANAGISRHVH